MKLHKHTDRKVLVAIDDSYMILHFLKQYLENDYEVITYSSSSEAVKDITSGKVNPDCILTDYYMPDELTGLDVIHKLNEAGSEVPIMVLSGSCDMNQKIECLTSGAVDFVNKPFNPGELEARIQNALAVSSNHQVYRHAV